MRITEEAALKIEKKLITYMMIGDFLGVHDNKTDTNGDSEYLADVTYDDNVCEKWEERN